MHKLWDNFATKEEPSFPLFRLMLPHLDTSSRPNYKLKQKKLADLYVDIMGMDKNSTDARTITEWKRPSSGLQRSEQGNFPEVMYSVLKNRCKPRAELRRVADAERLPTRRRSSTRPSGRAAPRAGPWCEASLRRC